jgi:phage FluMu gp28-like protein
MADKNEYFLPYQQRWINDDSKIKLFVKSRRIGGTYVQSYEDVEDCLLKKVPDVWFSSADESAAKEYIRYCEMWAKFFDAGLRVLGEVVIDKESDVKSLSIEFKNGARINALTSNPKAFRSKGGKVILDEFAHHKDQPQMWKAAKPVITWGYPARILSTHNGESMFYNFQQDIEKKKLGWSLHVVDIFTAVKEGLLDRIMGRPATEEERYDWLEEERRNCFDEYTWLEEYCCLPQIGKNVFLDYPLIASCEESGLLWPDSPLADTLELAKAQEPNHKESRWIIENLVAFENWLRQIEIIGNLFIGYDIGRKKDLSCIWVIEKLPGIKVTRAVIVLEKTRFWVQEEILYALLRHRKVSRCCIDSTGLGMQLAERAQEKFGEGKVEAINFATGSIRTDMAFYTKKCFEERSLLIPFADRVIRDDLHSMKKIVTTAGNIRLQAEKDEDVQGHADRFWGLSLALHAGQTELGPIWASSSRRRESGSITKGYF